MDRGSVRGKRPRQFAHHEIMSQPPALVFAGADLIGQFVFVERHEHRAATVMTFCYDAALVFVTICFY